MVICPIRVSQTASSGAWSFNTVKFSSAMLRQIIVEAATETTTFDLTITDDMGNIAFRTETKATGKLIREVEIPLKGIYTIAVSNSSADEAYTGRLSVKE